MYVIIVAFFKGFNLFYVYLNNLGLFFICFLIYASFFPYVCVSVYNGDICNSKLE